MYIFSKFKIQKNCKQLKKLFSFRKMLLNIINSKIFIRAQYIYQSFFLSVAINFTINIFIFLSLHENGWNCATDSPNIPLRYRFLHHPLPSSSPLNLCVILPLNTPRLVGISNYPRRVFSLPLRFFRLTLDFRASFVSVCTPIAFSISYSVVHDQHRADQ